MLTPTILEVMTFCVHKSLLGGEHKILKIHLRFRYDNKIFVTAISLFNFIVNSLIHITQR